MKWLSVTHATFGIIATAWTFPVKCFESQIYTGNVKPVLLQTPNRYSALWLCVLVHVQCTCMCEPDTQTVLSGYVCDSTAFKSTR